MNASTKPTLEEAMTAYRAVDDGDTSDDLWYGWKMEVDIAPVTIRVMKDGEPWSDPEKQFALKTDGNQDFITNLTAGVPYGTYTIYDTTGAADSTEYVDTGVTVTVDGTDAEATVNYYTVSFYDAAKEEVSEDTRPWQEEIVLERGTISAPDKADEPAKDGYTFGKWIREDGSAAFASGDAISITGKTDIYASWIPDTYSVTYYVNEEICTVAGEYGSYTYGTGLTLPIPYQAGYTFDGWYTDAGYTSEKANAVSETEAGDKVYYGRLAENAEPQPEDNMPADTKPDDNQPANIKPDDNQPADIKPDDNNAQPDVSENTGKKEPKTGDDSHIKIYATVAMIASFSYLLLYFTDEERGMTEQRKKEIVDWVIKWAKKGKRPRRLIAITAIFFLMVYYHGIGKYTATKCRKLNN